MIVLAFTPEEAERITRGKQTVVTYDDWLPGWPSNPKDLTLLRGQTVAIATTVDYAVRYITSPRPHGAIVGSARVRAVVPVYGITDGFNDGWKQWTWPNFQVNQDRTLLALVSGYEQMPAPLYDDQLPFADFTPGRWAVVLTDAKPCEERCPVCWGTGNPNGGGLACMTCEGGGTCAPIPYDITGPIGEWTP